MENRNSLEVSDEFGRIGGTTVSAIVGQNPWETAHSAYLKLRHEVDPTPDNTAMARGRRYEPIVAEIFAGGRPEFRVAHNRLGTDDPELYEHEQYPFLIGHPDRLLYDANTNQLVAGLEIKTSNWANVRNWGEEGTDAIPRHYLIQCLWYAGLAKLPEWRVAVAFLDDLGVLRSYREYNVIADEELYETLVASAVEFWNNHVLPGIPPAIGQIDDTTKRWINRRFPVNVQPLEVATPQEEQIMARYLMQKEALEAAQREFDYVEAALKMAIGDRDGLESETFGKVTWKRSKDSTRVDYRAVCDELNPSQELLAKHTKQVEGTRRFVASGLKVNI